MARPMYMDLRPKREIRAQTGTRLQCKGWDAEAALRMLRNNLNPQGATDWKELIIYGGQGRAARNWKEYHRIVRALKGLTGVRKLDLRWTQVTDVGANELGKALPHCRIYH